MPSSSFFSGLDLVSEHSKKSSRSNLGVPSTLQDSPYLSSPIRPIPSFRQRSSDFSVSSKRSRKPGTSTSVDDGAASLAQSTVGSLRLTSPYSDSIFSIHSLCTTSSIRQNENERQSLSRTVLLPDEIENLKKQLKYHPTSFQNQLNTKNENEENDQYNIVDFDDDSTIVSYFAHSIADENIFNKMEMDSDEDVLFNRNSDFPKEVSITENSQIKGNGESIKDNSNNDSHSLLKFPSVHGPDVLLRVGYNYSPSDKGGKKLSNHEGDSVMKQSPYAVNQCKTKRGTRKKKKGRNIQTEFKL